MSTKLGTNIRLLAKCPNRILNPVVGRRLFQSSEHPSEFRHSGQVAEEAVLKAAYAYVPGLGFSSQALAAGARDAGYPEISASLIPDGSVGLIRFHFASSQAALVPRSTELFGGSLGSGSRSTGVRERVERLLWERLLSNRAVIHKWQDALAIMAQPSHVPKSLEALLSLSDLILYLSGDESTDWAWYSKRASLSAIYGSCELFMTNDQSPDFQDTRGFLHRRLEESNSVGDAVHGICRWTSFTARAGLNMLRSGGMRI